MKIDGIGSPAVGPNVGPAAGPGQNPMVDALVGAERIPIQSAMGRRDKVASVKDSLQSFDGMLSKFNSSLEGLKNPSKFAKLAFESSHPDLIDGKVLDNAQLGSYEFEISDLARSPKQLAFGFPDRDKTEVGFGYLRVQSEKGLADLEITPGSTLQDVASKINDSVEGVRASIINTGVKEDPFRLLVSNVESGTDALVEIDPDTTFTEFKTLTQAQNLKASFEGVPIERAKNSFNDLIEGVHLDAKRAEPGTKVQVNIRTDVDKTAEGIKDFVKQYNDIAKFARDQSKVDPSTGKAGLLSGDSSLRQSITALQRQLGGGSSKGNGLSLNDVGISTDPHSGELKIDESKLKEKISTSIDAVSGLFANSEAGPGLAQKLSEVVKNLQSKSTGAIGSRLKGLDARIKNQDLDIAKAEERVDSKKAQLQRTFANLNAKMATLEGTSQFLNQRFGNSPDSSG
jgi:flagellar hook-associated protein 2